MAMYAGVCETDITPPLGVAMSGGPDSARRCTAIHDPLFARALVLENGYSRVVIVTLDLASLTIELSDELRTSIAQGVGCTIQSVLIACSGTNGSPSISAEMDESLPDAAYMDVMKRKIIGAAVQAASGLEPAHLTVGESSAQIGVSCRKVQVGTCLDRQIDYTGLVAPTVLTLCVNGADGRLMALLFSHSCSASTMGDDTRLITADWPGSAVARLKARFRAEGQESGAREDAMALFVQGFSADITPIRQSGWEAVRDNGRQIAEAAHSARWNAHGRQEESLLAEETVVDVSGAEGRAISLRIAHVQIGGLHVLGFPGDLQVDFQVDFVTRSLAPVLCVGLANGYVGTITTSYDSGPAQENRGSTRPSGGGSRRILGAEAPIRTAAYELLQVEDRDLTPYPPPYMRMR